MQLDLTILLYQTHYKVFWITHACTPKHNISLHSPRRSLPHWMMVAVSAGSATVLPTS